MGRRLFENSGEFLLFLTLGLLFIGGVNIFSSSFVVASQDYNNRYHFLIRHYQLKVIHYFYFFYIFH